MPLCVNKFVLRKTYFLKIKMNSNSNANEIHY